MKYRTKLYIGLVSVALASIITALAIFSTETERLVFKMFRSRLLSIVSTAAAQINPQIIQEGSFASNAQDPAYKKARKELNRILQANRRSDIYIADLYTLVVDPKKTNLLFYGIETSEDPYQPLTPYIESDTEFVFENKLIPFTSPKLVSDQLGVWLSGYAPIFDTSGQFVALLGADINASDIYKQLHKVIGFALWGLWASLILALVAAFFLSKKVTQSLDHLCHVVGQIGEGNLQIEANLQTEDEFGHLGSKINAMTLGLQERERLKLSFASYVSTPIMEKILASSSPLKLEGERRKVTLLFSDIRQFTQLAERLRPEEVVQILNQFFEQMIEIIFAQAGTLDKFLGDGIMAEFGAPLEDEEQEKHAVLAAIEMQKAVIRLSDIWEKEGKTRIQMGIGIHTGEAVVGNIGSEKRTDYTAIGDAVNVAARLEQATKILKTPILISESTYLATKDLFPYKDLGLMALPGRKEQIRVYTIETPGEN